MSIEVALAALTAAVDRNTAALTGGGAKAATGKAGKAATETAATTAAATTAAATTGPEYKTVANALVKVAEAPGKGRDRVIAILGELQAGCASLTTLAPALLGAALKRFTDEMAAPAESAASSLV